MTEIVNGTLQRNDVSANAMGGTELIMQELANRIEVPLLQEFQIVASRKRELQDDKIRIFYCHDLPGDPESEFLKDRNNHDLFHRYAFVSNWQMQQYIQYYSLPWSKCIVLRNAIEPIEEHEKPDPKDGLRFIYTPTPHRGLNILVPVFQELTKDYKNIHLDVFSSFKLYGWEERDKPYQELFDQISNNKYMTYHGTQSNEKVREAIKQSHSFVYPSTWPETSCICLLEAMSGGLLSIHSNYAALPETSANLTSMYQYNEDPNHHAGMLYTMMKNLIEMNEHDSKFLTRNTFFMKNYIDSFYSWDARIPEWESYLRGLLSIDLDRRIPSETITYSTT